MSLDPTPATPDRPAPDPTRSWLVVNPAAGHDDPPRYARLLASARRRGWAVHETTHPADATDLPRAACDAGCVRLIVGGGDGTLHAAAAALATCDAPPILGILPLGTANDFARGLGLPRDPEEALDVAERATTRPVDLVCITQADGTSDAPSPSQYMLNAAAGGLSVDLRDALDDADKQRWGGLAYAKALAEVIHDAPTYRVTLTVDDQPAETLDLVALIFLNGPRAGGQHLLDHADATDGKLDAVLIAAQEFSERISLAVRFLTGTHEDSPHLTTRRGTRFVVESDPPMPFLADGEPLADTPLTFTLEPAKLRVAVDEPPA